MLDPAIHLQVTVLLAGAGPRGVALLPLSAESTAGTIDALAGVAAYPGLVLLVGTENDIYAPGGVTRRMAELHPGDEQVLLFPGSDHGIQLLPRTQQQVVAFIVRVLPV